VFILYRSGPSVKNEDLITQSYPARIIKSSAMSKADCVQIIQLYDQVLVASRLPQACFALCGSKLPVAKINMQIRRCLIIKEHLLNKIFTRSCHYRNIDSCQR
jgi:hypothetical protein